MQSVTGSRWDNNYIPAVFALADEMQTAIPGEFGSSQPEGELEREKLMRNRI